MFSSHKMAIILAHIGNPYADTNRARLIWIFWGLCWLQYLAEKILINEKSVTVSITAAEFTANTYWCLTAVFLWWGSSSGLNNSVELLRLFCAAESQFVCFRLRVSLHHTGPVSGHTGCLHVCLRDTGKNTNCTVCGDSKNIRDTFLTPVILSR